MNTTTASAISVCGPAPPGHRAAPRPSSVPPARIITMPATRTRTPGLENAPCSDICGELLSSAGTSAAIATTSG